MAISFAKPLSVGHCLGPPRDRHHLSVLLPLAVSCRRKNSQITLTIGPRYLQQRSKIADFSCFSLPWQLQTPVAIAKGLQSAFAADSPDGGVDSDISGDPEPFSSSPDSNSDRSVDMLDLNLPRRSLLVLFTCDACGSRTKRIINRHAYEHGTVFIQCAGCEAYHKLVDNLGLVVEYDFRDDPDNHTEELLEG